MHLFNVVLMKICASASDREILCFQSRMILFSFLINGGIKSENKEVSFYVVHLHPEINIGTHKDG